METIISDDLKLFLTKECAITQEILASSDLQSDLGIYGDDATELLTAYSERFGVDVSAFMAADYFDNEGVDIIGLIRSLFSGRKRNRKPFTVLHLQKGINANKLNEFIIMND